jgi:hypothetical protein
MAAEWEADRACDTDSGASESVGVVHRVGGRSSVHPRACWRVWLVCVLAIASGPLDKEE